jgi:hypothetical protein
MCVARVNDVEERLVRHRAAGRDSVEAVELGRPGDPVGVDVPRPAADVCDGLRLGKLVFRVRPFGEHRAEDEHADRDPCEQAFQDLHDLGRVSVAERNVPTDGSRDGDRRDDDAARHRTNLAEAQGRPDEERKEEVRVAPVAGEEDKRAEPGDERE